MTSKSRFDLNEVGNKATHDKHVVALEPSDSVFMRGRIKDQLRKKWGDEGVVIVHNHILMDVWTDDDEKIAFLIKILG